VLEKKKKKDQEKKKEGKEIRSYKTIKSTLNAQNIKKKDWNGLNVNSCRPIKPYSLYIVWHGH
jgi:hypothetical protein